MSAIQILPGWAPRDEWLALRRSGIGASEIGAVLGLSPYDSPFSVYWRKKLGTETVMTEAMEWGLRHERAIGEKFAENHRELYVDGEGAMYRHPEYEWMTATPDRLVYELDEADDEDRLVGVAQLKTAHSFDGWGRDGTDQVPLYYRAQVMQEMGVMGVTRCWMPVLATGNTYREYVIDFDESDFATIVKEGAAFMARLAADDPPDVDSSPATLEALKTLHPSVVDECVTIPQDLADRYITRKQLLADARTAMAAADNEMRAALGAATTAVSDGRRIASRRVFDVARLDTTRLREDHPELCAQYEKTSTTDALVMSKEIAL